MVRGVAEGFAKDFPRFLGGQRQVDKQPTLAGVLANTAAVTAEIFVADFKTRLTGLLNETVKLCD